MRSHTLGSLLVLQALFLASRAFGGPLLPDEATAAPALSETTGFGHVAPADTSPLRSGATASDGIPHPVVTSARRQNSEAATGAQSSSPQPLGPARAKAAAPPSRIGTNPAGPGSPIDDDFDPELKEAAKAALQWVREARDRIEPARAGQGFEAADRSASAPAGNAAGFSGDMRSTPGQPREYQATPLPGHPIGPPTGTGLDPIQAGIKLVKDIAGHPLTWLLIVLVVLGSVGVAFLQHQSHVARRRLKRHATSRQPGLSDRSGRRRERRSPGAAPVGRAEQKPERAKVRDAAKPR